MAARKDVGTQSVFSIDKISEEGIIAIEGSAPAGQAYNPDLTDVRLVQKISDSQIAVAQCRNGRHSVALKRHDEDGVRIIEPHFDHEITWITASREFLLIAHGGPQPKLVIYKLAGPFNVPDRSIDLQ